MHSNEIPNQVKKIVEEACKKKSNPFGYGAWTHHVSSVAKYAKILARKHNADEEIVELAALLHDYAGILDKKMYYDHHIHGARIAGEILGRLGYPEEKIEQVKHCILAHRSSKNIKRETIEAEIIADADNLAHFGEIISLLYLVFVEHKKGIEEGSKWVLIKLERDWVQLSLEAKKIIKPKYDAAKLLLRTEWTQEKY